MLSLIPIAENVVKLNAVCMNCFKDAAFTMRLGSETKVVNDAWHRMNLKKARMMKLNTTTGKSILKSAKVWLRNAEDIVLKSS